MKNKKEFDNFTESHSTPDVFSFSEKENEKQFLNEDFVFKAEDNTNQTGADLNTNSYGIEDNDNYHELDKPVKKDDDDRKEKQKDTESNSSAESSSSSSSASSSSTASSSSSSSSTSSSSAVSSSSAASTNAAAASSGVIGAIAATATAAAVIVVGGGIVMHEAYKEPTVCQFQEVAAIENSVHFSLILGTDNEKIIMGEEKDETDCFIEISAKEFTYSSQVDAKYFGIVEGEFKDLEWNSEYSLAVYRPTMLGADREPVGEPVSIRTPGKETPLLKEIKISGEYQTEFFVNDEFNHEGLVVTAYYSNGTTKEIPNTALEFSSPDMSIAGENVIAIKFTEGDVTVSASYTIRVSVAELISIELSGEYQTEFFVNSPFNYEGLVVTANYSNGESKELTIDNYTVSTPDMSYAGDKTVEVSYVEDGVTHAATYTISVVEPKVTAIEISGTYQTQYYVGDTEISVEGMVIIAYVEDGTTKEISSDLITYTTPDMSTAGDKTVTVTYMEGENEITTTYVINVMEVKATSMELSGTYQTEFYTGDDFTSEGLIVTITNNNGSTKVLSEEEYNIVTPDLSTAGEKTVTVEYASDFDINASYTITVTQLQISSISLSGDYPTEFWPGDDFTYEGLIVTATYNNGTTKEIPDGEYVVNGPTADDMAQSGEKYVEVSYTENGITKRTHYEFVVKEIILESISLSGEYQTEYTVGDQINVEGLEVTANYNDGTSKELAITDLNWSSPDMSTPGEKTVTIYYQEGTSSEVTASYTINVSELLATRIELSGTYNTEFYVNEEFTYEGLIVTVFFENDTSREAESNEYEVTPPTMTSAGEGEVTVTYTASGEQISETYIINIVEPEPTSLSLSGTYQTEFYVGDDFTAMGLVVTLNYEDGSSKTLEDSEYSLSEPSSMLESGEQQIFVVYLLNQDISTSYTIIINDIEPEEITIEVIKDEYELGEEIDLTSDLVVTLHYNNGDTETLSAADFDNDPVDMTTPGDKTVTINYEGLSASYNIYVNEETVGPSAVITQVFTIHNYTNDEFYIGLQIDVTDERSQIDSSLTLVIQGDTATQRYILDDSKFDFARGYYFTDAFDSDQAFNEFYEKSYSITATVDGNENTDLCNEDSFTYIDYGVLPGSPEVVLNETNETISIIVHNGDEVFSLDNYTDLCVQIRLNADDDAIFTQENITVGEEINTGVSYTPGVTTSYIYEIYGTPLDGGEPILIYTQTIYVS